MGILQRAADIMSANINALLDKAEDPEKMAEQYLLDYKKDLAEAKVQAAKFAASCDSAGRDLEKCRSDIAEYQTAAENALRSGDEDAARRLIETKQGLEAKLIYLETTYEDACKDADEMARLYNKLAGDIKSLEDRRDAIKRTQARAKAQESLNRARAKDGRMDQVEGAMSRMEEKAQRRLDEALASEQMEQEDGSEVLLKKYRKPVSSVDDELAAMKAKLGGE